MKKIDEVIDEINKRIKQTKEMLDDTKIYSNPHFFWMKHPHKEFVQFEQHSLKDLLFWITQENNLDKRKE